MDFLQGFSLSDSPRFDEWANSGRERNRLLAMRGYATLAHHFRWKIAGKPKEATSQGKTAEMALPRDRLYQTTRNNSEGVEESGWKGVILVVFKLAIPFNSNQGGESGIPSRYIRLCEWFTRN